MKALQRCFVLASCLALAHCGGGDANESPAGTPEVLQQASVQDQLAATAKGAGAGQAVAAARNIMQQAGPGAPVNGASVGRAPVSREPASSGGGTGTGGGTGPVFGGGGSGGTGGGGSTGSAGSDMVIDPGDIRAIHGIGVPVKLFHPVTMRLMFDATTGLKSQCRVSGGKLPEGLALQPDCAVSGRVSRDVSLSTVVIEGMQNRPEIKRSMQLTMMVSWPELSYPPLFNSSSTALQDQSVQLRPSFGYWTMPPDFAVTFSYRIRSGALPTGLVLDPATGVISGVMSQPGFFSASIGATMSDGRRADELTPTIIAGTVVPNFSGSWTYQSGNSWTYVGEAYLGVPYLALPRSDVPGTVSDAVLESGALPPGLTLSAATGAISGIPTVENTPELEYFRSTIRATVKTTSGASGPRTTSFVLRVRQPIAMDYERSSTIYAWVGKPLSIEPLRSRYIADPPHYVISYAIRESDGWNATSCNLARAGLALDPATGIVSGAPRAEGNLFCKVAYAVTMNGVSWKAVADLSIYIFP